MSLLTQILGLPLVAAVVLLFVPRTFRVVIRAVAVGGTLLTALLALRLLLLFDAAPPGPGGYKFVEQFAWAPSLGISYLVGVDGINLGLIVMGAIVAFAAACVSWDIADRQKEFYVLLLVMTGGILGAFASLDVFFMYFLHELALVPTFIMIGVWGRGERKNYAAFQITLYLSVGALVALIGLLALYLQSGVRTFNLLELAEHLKANPMPADRQSFIFAWLMFGLGILFSLWPFHTWAPLGYSAAPTATAMLHAGVLKKFGLYALLRIGLPLLPEGAKAWLPVLAWLCLGNIIYCGLVAVRQRDLNFLFGNSSVAHVGFVCLGLASLTLVGMTGAVVVMVAHGFLAALSFGASGYLYAQRHSLDRTEMGGLLKPMPFLGTVLIMAMLAGCGLPGFGNFVGELLVLFGAWKSQFMVGDGWIRMNWIAVFAAWGALIIAAVYMLNAVRTMFHGPVAEAWSRHTDPPGAWRKLPFVVLVGSLLIIGCWPRLLTDRIEPSARLILDAVTSSTPTRALAGAATPAPTHRPP